VALLIMSLPQASPAVASPHDPMSSIAVAQATFNQCVAQIVHAGRE
jgi:hypothetical protein